MIFAKNYIKTGFSADDAAKLNEIIKPMFDRGEKIQVDFEEITIYTTLFFNHVFAMYLTQIGPEEYDRRFEITGLSELGNTTYQHSIENAKNYYRLSDHEKTEQEKILEKPEE